MDGSKSTLDFWWQKSTTTTFYESLSVQLESVEGKAMEEGKAVHCINEGNGHLCLVSGFNALTGGKIITNFPCVSSTFSKTCLWRY